VPPTLHAPRSSIPLSQTQRSTGLASGPNAGKLLARWGVLEAQKEGEDVVASVLCGEKNRGFYGKAGMNVQVSETKGKGGGIALFTR
jgi:hypothetical protein